MTTLYIEGCVEDGKDPGYVSDAVYGDGFFLRMDRAIQLASAGVNFKARVFGLLVADVRVAKSPLGRLYLKTSPDALVANNLGEITSKRQVAVNAFATSLASNIR